MRQIKKLLALVLALVMTMGLATIGAEAKVTDNGTGDLKNVTLSGALTISGTATYESITVKDGGQMILTKNAKVTTDTLKVEDGGEVQLMGSGAGALTVNKELTVEKGAAFEGNTTTDAAALTTGTDAKVSVDDSVKENIEKIADATTDTKIESGSSETPGEETKSLKVTVAVAKGAVIGEDESINVKYTDPDGKTAKSVALVAGDSKEIEIYTGIIDDDGVAAGSLVTFELVGVNGTKKTVTYTGTEGGDPVKNVVSDANADKSFTLIDGDSITVNIEKKAAARITLTDIAVTGVSGVYTDKSDTTGAIYEVKSGDTVTITSNTFKGKHYVIKDGAIVGEITDKANGKLTLVVPEGGITIAKDDVHAVYGLKADTAAIGSFTADDGNLRVKDADGYDLFDQTKLTKLTVSGAKGKYVALVDAKEYATYKKAILTSNYQVGADATGITLSKKVASSTDAQNQYIVTSVAKFDDEGVEAKLGGSALNNAGGENYIVAGQKVTLPTGKTFVASDATASNNQYASSAKVSSPITMGTTDIALKQVVQITFDSSIKAVGFAPASGGASQAVAAETNARSTGSTGKLSSGALVEVNKVYLYAIANDTSVYVVSIAADAKYQTAAVTGTTDYAHQNDAVAAVAKDLHLVSAVNVGISTTSATGVTVRYDGIVFPVSSTDRVFVNRAKLGAITFKTEDGAKVGGADVEVLVGVDGATPAALVNDNSNKALKGDTLDYTYKPDAKGIKSITITF